MIAVLGLILLILLVVCSINNDVWLEGMMTDMHEALLGLVLGIAMLLYIRIRGGPDAWRIRWHSIRRIGAVSVVDMLFDLSGEEEVDASYDDEGAVE